MPRLTIHLSCTTTKSVRAAADLAARCIEERTLDRTADLIRSIDGVTYVVRLIEGQIKVRESEGLAVAADGRREPPSGV